MEIDALYAKEDGFYVNVQSLARYIDNFAEGMGLTSLHVSSENLVSLAATLTQDDFPHVDGVEKASPFKLAANFFVWFINTKPITEEFPEEIIGSKLKSIKDHQNVIMAYQMTKDMLWGATLQKNGETVVLSEPISVSDHFFHDFVEAFSGCTHVSHFKVASLLFEQLAYCANPTVSYERVF